MSIRNAIAIFTCERNERDTSEFGSTIALCSASPHTFAILMDAVAVAVAVQCTISISVHGGTVPDRMFAVAVGRFWCIGCIPANRNVTLRVALWGGRRTIGVTEQTIVRIVVLTPIGFA